MVLQVDAETIGNRLGVRQRELEALLARIERQAGRFSDTGSFAEGVDIDGWSNEVVGELLLIRAAQGRLADGSYGECVACSGPITGGRLRIDPCVATCLDCHEHGHTRRSSSN